MGKNYYIGDWPDESSACLMLSFLGRVHCSAWTTAAWAKKAEVTGMLTTLAMEFKAQIAASQANKESTPLRTPIAADVLGCIISSANVPGGKEAGQEPKITKGGTSNGETSSHVSCTAMPGEVSSLLIWSRLKDAKDELDNIRFE